MAYWYYGILGILNLGALLAMGWDKRQARLGRRRIAERTLWAWSGIGGSLGIIAGMWWWRHKNRKPSFYLVAYGIVLVQLVLLGWLR